MTMKEVEASIDAVCDSLKTLAEKSKRKSTGYLRKYATNRGTVLQ